MRLLTDTKRIKTKTMSANFRDPKLESTIFDVM